MSLSCGEGSPLDSVGVRARVRVQVRVRVRVQVRVQVRVRVRVPAVCLLPHPPLAVCRPH